MLKIFIPDQEIYDNKKGEFFNVKGGSLSLEHSLLSIYKWESKWNESFLSKMEKRGTPLTSEQSRDYVKCMVVDGQVDDLAYYFIPDKEWEKINAYLNAPMTATTFGDSNEPPSRDVITAEIIYWQMTVLNIPLEFEKRHLNHLLTLIKVCSIKNSPPKKMSKKDIYRRNRELNEARKKKMHSKG